MAEIGSLNFRVVRVLKTPRISDVSALKLALVSAAYCFQSSPGTTANEKVDDLEEEVDSLPCTCSTRLVFSLQEGDDEGDEEEQVLGSDVDNDVQ